jgi:hypothetical protein
MRLAPVLLASSFSLLFAPHHAAAQSCTMNRRIAARVSEALRPSAPAWAQPLLTPALVLRYERDNLRPLTYLLGYALLSVERLGVRGAPSFSAAVVVRCRDARVQLITDPIAWANERARELHLTIGNAEIAAGFAAEVISLQAGRRPDAANATRAAGSSTFRVTVSLAPRQGETETQTILLEIERDGTLRRVH